MKSSNNQQDNAPSAQTAENLGRDEDRLARAVQGSCDGFWEWNLQTDKVWYAPGYRELLGFAENDDDRETFESWQQRLHPEDRKAVVDSLQHHVESDHPCDHSYDAEYRLATGGGEHRWFRARGTSFRDPQGQAICMAGAIQDIDDLKRAQESLKEKEAQLLQQQKLDAVGSLAGGIAHEFNNLLQAIRGYTIFAQEQLVAGTQPYQDLQCVVTAADRATLLTRQLLDFSRADPADPRRCSTDQIAHDLADMLRSLLPENIDFRLRAEAPEASIVADPNQIQQALMNLCINARDAMPDGGELLVRTDQISITETTSDLFASLPLGKYLRVSVTDTGSGISHEIQQHVFEPFFTTKEVGKGTGLGLAMAFGVVQQAGGLLQLYSESGEGTTFRIYLPNHEDVPMDEEKPTLEQSNGETVLLAEDDALVREVGRRMLQRAGYHVLDASNGEEALELYVANANEINLLILDVVMPRLTGREVFEHVRRLNSNVPICFCTGYDPEAAQSDSLRRKGCQVVEKPFVEAHFLSVVRAVLEKSDAHPLTSA